MAAPILFSLLVLISASARAAGGLPDRDRALIEALLAGVKSSSYKFIRKDQTFDAKTAAWYLRFRWDQNRAKIESVQDFIDLVSVGGEHGEITYYVEFPDAVRKPAREVLDEALARLAK